MKIEELNIYHGPKSWNNTAQKNAQAEFESGLSSYSYTYNQLFNPINLYKAIIKSDIIHFYSGYSFIPISQNWHKTYATFGLADIPILKKMGKKIILHMQGCEIRDRYHQQAQTVCTSCAIRDSFCRKDRSIQRRKRFESIFPYVDALAVTTPDLLEYLPRNTCPVHFIPKIEPQNKGRELINIDKPTSQRLTILHAPSDRSIKGTDEIIRIIDKHSDKFELTLIENMSRETVLNTAINADVAIDQIRVGWYGNFAVEMMSIGTPVIAYIREDLIRSLGLEPPAVINADAENLESILLNLFENKESLKQLSDMGKAYTKKNHSAEAIALKLRNIYNSFI